MIVYNNPSKIKKIEPANKELNAQICLSIKQFKPKVNNSRLLGSEVKTKDLHINFPA